MLLIARLKSYLFATRNLSSLIDQVLVSGGNFLTIAICAHALPLSEQGKFTYIFASYMALLLLNVAGIFQGAAVRAPAQERDPYKISLARLQLLQALLLSMLVCAAWFGVGNIFGWQATATEAVMLFAFLVMQQLADFDRRSAYIFSGTKRAIYSSAALYPIRIIGLLIIRPDTVSQVLMVLIASAFIPAAFALLTTGKSRYGSPQSWKMSIKEHLTYSRLFIAGAPLSWLWSYIPVFMLGVMHGKEQVALLSSIRGICGIANVLMEQIEIKVVTDWARVHHGEGAHVMGAAISHLFKIGMAFWLLTMAAVVVFGKEIVALVLGNLYAPHWHLLMIAWVGYGVYFIARIFAIKHRILGANHVEFVGNMSGVMAALTAGYVMIPSLKATGAAWVYVIIAAAMLISQILVLKREKIVAK
jgi:O-antigen/teichoic acid export membrane protein